MKKEGEIGELEDGQSQLNDTEEAVEVGGNGFKKATREIREDGLREMSENHDGNLVYHTSEHPKAVERNAKKLAKIFGLSQEQIDILGDIIAYHDTKIKSTKPDSKNITGMLARHRGAREGDNKFNLDKLGKKGTEGNEGLSAQALKEKMKKVNDDAREEIFTQDQIDNAVWAIEATYPDVNLGSDFKEASFKEYAYFDVAVEQNPDLGEVIKELKDEGVEKGPLFFQPHLEKPLEEGKPVPREVLITGLSDLGGVGLMEKDTFFKDGNDEMREVYHNLRNPDVMDRLAKGQTDEDVTDREKVAQAFIGWLESQSGFAVFQALRFEKIMHLLKEQNAISSKEEGDLREEFRYYIDNIRAAHERAKKLKEEFGNIKSATDERQAFVFLANEMGYEIK